LPFRQNSSSSFKAAEEAPSVRAGLLLVPKRLNLYQPPVNCRFLFGFCKFDNPQQIWHILCNKNKELAMPEISLFYGIRITMNWDEHNPPHFHVKYVEYKDSKPLNEIQPLI
jgi:hypothetical protein